MATKMKFSNMEDFIIGNSLKKRPLMLDRKKNRHSIFRNSKISPTLGILAFETAKVMSRLVSLHKSLSDTEHSKLLKEIVKLEGVSYLISKDEDYLLKLACMEKMEDLDRAGIVVARLGKRCSNPDLKNFERIYSDMKLGLFDLNNFSAASKEAQKTMGKLERFVSDTSELYSSLESLLEMEASERKIMQWKNNVNLAPKINYDLFEAKISWQRQKVRHLRQVSLWGQTFNKTVRLMAGGICIVYARLRVAFSPYIVKPTRHMRYASDSNLDSLCINKMENGGRRFVSKSGPIPSGQNNVGFGGFKLIHQAGPSTIGGSGLTLRLAKVVLTVDKYMKSRSSISDSGREDLYHMLPTSLKRLVKSKLKKFTTKELEQSGDDSLTEGWKEGLNRILGWLAPMAQDTIKWHMERNVEKQNFDPRAKVLLLQTLFFADREKSEVAIAEVLVGLSCICKYETLH
ncbi:plant/protein [Thalictrum thalictroides]|uniref:Plant/protein n=1 Tax=Thalictrum thalictroides TaxID=46969 RepID=A0A7J6V6A7_THATH|nr:plant/protein [Thalictrum thalictroides]